MLGDLKLNDILSDDNLECYEYRGFDSLGKVNQYFYEEPKTKFESSNKDFKFEDNFISDPRLTKVFEYNEEAKFTMIVGNNKAIDVVVESECSMPMIVLLSKSKRQARCYAGDILTNTLMTRNDAIIAVSYIDHTIHINFIDKGGLDMVQSTIGIPQKNLFSERAISEWIFASNSLTYRYDNNGLLLEIKNTNLDADPKQFFRREIHYFLKEYEGNVCYNMPYFVSSNQLIVDKPGTRIFFVDKFSCTDGKIKDLQRTIYIVRDEDKCHKLKQMLSSGNDNIIL